MFLLMRLCIFGSSCFSFLFLFVHLHSLSAFKNPKRGTSTTTPALYTENEWPDFNESIIVVEEEEKDENSIREFTKLIEQHE